MKVKELCVVLHNVRSAYNVGAIFRTADAVGVKKIYLCGYTPIPETRDRKQGNPKIAKTALGAEKTVPWEYYPQARRLLKQLRQQKYQLIALEQTRRSENVFSFKPKFPVALIVGNEVRGLSPAVFKYAHAILEIPMRGKKESLNVSVAAGIAFYELSGHFFTQEHS